MEKLKALFGKTDIQALLYSSMRIILILVGAWITWLILKYLLIKMENRIVRRSRAEGVTPTEAEKRADTLVHLVERGLLFLVWISALLMVLQEVKIDIAPILASAGIVGLAVGFGAQNLVKDVISGFFLILENQVRVGDVIKVNGTAGLVERVNFRTLILRDLSGTVHILPNGSIGSLSNLTRDWSAYVFEVGVAYKEKVDNVIEVIKEIAADMREDQEFGPKIIEDVEIFGVDKLGDSSVIIKGRIKTTPSMQWQVGRAFLKRVKNTFDEKGIEIPFPHRSIYFGEASKPFSIKDTQKLNEK